MQRLFLGIGILALVLFGLQFEAAQAQSLEVQAVSQNGTLPRNGVRIPLLSINMRANAQDVTLKAVNLSRSGLSSNEDIDRVWLQQGYSRLSRSRQFSNDDQLTLELTRDFVIKANTTERIYVLANLSFDGGGRTLQINLESLDTDANVTTPKLTPSPTTRTTTNRTERTPGVFTTSRARYDRSQYRVVCRNSRCSLVKR